MQDDPTMSSVTFVTVTPRASGGLVHITSLTDAHRTACNKVCAGWKVVAGNVSCEGCKAAVVFPVKRRRRKVA